MTLDDMDETARQFLKRLFEQTEGQSSRQVSMYEVGAALGDLRLQAGMARPVDGADDWWLPVLWVAHDDGVVTFREVGPASGPPPGPPPDRASARR